MADLGISAQSTLIFISWIDVTVQIDALYHYPARTLKDEKQPPEKHTYGTDNSQWIGGIEYRELPITVELKLKPGSTFRSFAHSLKSHILNQLPVYWPRDECRADEPEDIFFSISPEAESSTVRALQSKGIGLELKRDEKISKWRCGNIAFIHRADKHKEYAHVEFSVKGPSSPIPPVTPNAGAGNECVVIDVGDESDIGGCANGQSGSSNDGQMRANPESPVSENAVGVTKTESVSGRRAVWRQLRCMLPKCTCLRGQEKD